MTEECHLGVWGWESLGVSLGSVLSLPSAPTGADWFSIQLKKFGVWHVLQPQGNGLGCRLIREERTGNLIGKGKCKGRYPCRKGTFPATGCCHQGELDLSSKALPLRC